MVVAFKGIKLSVKLIQQSDLIHFQYNETGATLRASEVKPKLDRFLLTKAKEQLSDKSYIDKENGALNYKMRLYDNRSRFSQEDLSTVTFPLKKINRRKVTTNPTLVITCFVPELQRLIEKYLETFFVVTNFGFLQGKGYGSFLVGDSYLTDDDIYKILKETFGLSKLYRMDCHFAKQYSQIFARIKNFYQLTKSGYNFRGKHKRSALFEYMHDRDIGNEKAELKQRRVIEPQGTYKKPYYPPNVNPHYVRALLGLANSYVFKGDDYEQEVKIESLSDIQRYPSPIYFKIINNKVYIIPVWNSQLKTILGKSFLFSAGEKSLSLNTPQEFNVYDFLDHAVKYYNTHGPSLFNNYIKIVQI